MQSGGYWFTAACCNNILSIKIKMDKRMIRGGERERASESDKERERVTEWERVTERVLEWERMKEQEKNVNGVHTGFCAACFDSLVGFEWKSQPQLPPGVRSITGSFKHRARVDLCGIWCRLGQHSILGVCVKRRVCAPSVLLVCYTRRVLYHREIKS